MEKWKKKSSKNPAKIKAKHALIIMELSLLHTPENETLCMCIWVRKWQELNAGMWKI